MTRLLELHPALRGGPYRAYVYAYPHKTAYRRFDPPRPLREVWAAEPGSGLFLYVHVPFCTMRCGFCNLFTTPNPKTGLVALYLDALRRQAETVRTAITEPRFARFAVGGGTPTFFNEEELIDRLHKEIVAYIASTEGQKKLMDMGLTPGAPTNGTRAECT